MKQHLKLLRGFFFCLVLLFGFFLTYSSADEEMKIGGEFVAKYATREVQQIGDAEEHVVVLSTLEGTLKSTGEHEFMDGGAVLIIGMSDMTKGNGVSWGYAKTTLGDDVVYAKYKGKVTTTLSEGNPVTVFEIEAEFIKGSGKYENIQGGYKAKAKVISENEMMIKWEGTYSIKE